MATRMLSAQAKKGLRALILDACQSDLPCASATVVSKDSELFHYEAISKSDYKSCNLQDEPAHDHVYWLASCTKLITAIACMQVVEQKKLALDDGDQLEELCPELRDVKVLQRSGSMIEKRRQITLRMLLTHTAGFGYSFINEKLKKHSYEEFSGLAEDFCQPLVNHPGERFEYGINIDWVGIAVERASKTRLGHYMQKHIFEPSGIKDLSIVPSKDMKDRLAGFWHREANGRLSPRPYPLSTPLTSTQASNIFYSGGAGVWGTTREFSKLLRVLLNNGLSPLTGEVILRPETVGMMFENQLPQDPNFARTSLPAVKPNLVYAADELYPLCPKSEPQGWGLSFMISPSVTGRSKHTAHWSGLSNCFWWCDRENGVAGIVGSQVLPFADPKAVQLWANVEEATYIGLE